MVEFGDTRLPLRFWAKCFVAQSGCWLWIGAQGRGGYGHFKHPVSKKVRKAHRVAYEFLVQEIPEDLELDHSCDTPRCVNVNHLDLGTRRSNILRGTGPTAMNARKTHCIRGHEFIPENTIIRARGDYGGGRECRECQRTYNAERRA